VSPVAGPASFTNTAAFIVAFESSGGSSDWAREIARTEGVEDVGAWCPGRVFEVTARMEGMNNVAAYV